MSLGFYSQIPESDVRARSTYGKLGNLGTKTRADDLRVMLVNGLVKAQPFSLIPSFLDFTEHLDRRYDVIPLGRPDPRNF